MRKSLRALAPSKVVMCRDTGWPCKETENRHSGAADWGWPAKAVF
jgi:hypothetical protein